MVHKITQNNAVVKIVPQMKPARKVFEEIYRLYDVIYREYRDYFYQKKVELLNNET